MASHLPVARQGCTLVVEVAGDGPGVVLTHGAGMDRRMFAPQVDFLAERGYRVVTWDMRGHGESRPAGLALTNAAAEDDLVAVMDAAELPTAVLVGQSLGGNVAQAVARRFPERVSALVVIDSAWNAEPLTRADRVALRTSVPLLRLMPWAWLVRRMARASATTDQGRRLAQESFAQLSRGEFLRAWTSAVGELGADPTEPSSVPLCLICGELDGTGQVRRSMHRWAERSQVDLHVVAQAGHLSNVDRPDTVNGLLLDFLSELSV